MMKASTVFPGGKANWQGACTGTGACVVTMDADKILTATFKINQYALTVTKSGAGTGTVSSTPAGIDCGLTCTASFDYNTPVTLTATADPGSTFAGWSGACSGVDPVCTVTVNADPAVWLIGIPVLPLEMPGAADSPSTLVACR